MRKNILPIILSAAIAIIFLYIVLTPPSAFNMIPFAIHEWLFKGIIKEVTFIVIFDIITSVILFFIGFYIFRRIVKA
jgi:hypothetical protein